MLWNRKMKEEVEAWKTFLMLLAESQGILEGRHPKALQTHPPLGHRGPFIFLVFTLSKGGA